MIKLTLPPKPSELTDQVQKELTEKFKADGSSVWNKDYIKEALLDMTNNKCAYSEVKFDGGSYMEVEHFYCKDRYPDKVVEWGNMFPSCKTCNDCKGSIDVADTPIVNPVTDNPQDHLYISDSLIIKGKTPKGANTVECLNLNSRTQFGDKRYDIWLRIYDQLDDLLNSWDDNITDRKKRNIVNGLRGILDGCDRGNEFSAYLSTLLVYHESPYGDLKSRITAAGLWSQDLQEKEDALRAIALPK